MVRRKATGRLAGAALVALLAGCVALTPRPLPLRVTLEAVRVTRLTAADARFRLALAVQNPNAYDLVVSALDARLAVEGEPLATGSLVAPAVLNAGASTAVEIEARTSLGAVAAVVERVAGLAIVRYEVSGAAVVQDGVRLPFNRSGELPARDFLGLNQR